MSKYYKDSDGKTYRYMRTLPGALLTIALIGVAATGCGDNVVGPANEPQVTNAADDFQLQWSNLSNVSANRQYTWSNSGPLANIPQSVGGGSDSLNTAEATVDPVGPKKLYLADFDNDRIWVLNLDTREVITSYPVPTREVGQDAFPIGLAWLRGRLYVNNFNFAYQCTNDDLFAINPKVGVVLGQAHTPGCNPIDGMAAIPDAGLLAGIEITIWEGQTVERLHLFQPIFGRANAHLSLTEVDIIDIDVPGSSVRGLAYLNQRLYVSEEVTESIYIYRLDLSMMTVTFEGSIFIGTHAPGLATLDEGHLIAYDILSHRLLIVEAQEGGEIVDTIPLDDTGIGSVAALETQMHPDGIPQGD